MYAGVGNLTGYGAVGFGVLEVHQQVQGLNALLVNTCGGDSICRLSQIRNLASPWSRAVEIMFKQRLQAGEPTDQLFEAIVNEVMIPQGNSNTQSRANMYTLLNRAKLAASKTQQKSLLTTSFPVVSPFDSKYRQAPAPDASGGKISQKSPGGGTSTTEEYVPTEETGPTPEDDKSKYMLYGGIALAGLAVVYLATKK